MTKIHILAPAPISTAYVARLARQFPNVDFSIGISREEVGEGFRGCEALLTFSDLLKPDWLREANNLRWVQALGAGLDGIADSPDLNDDITVSSMKGVHAPQVSEHALMLMLCQSRNFPRSVQNQSANVWERWPAKLLQKKTVGLLGVGAIAEALAKRCKALEMDVVGLTRSPRLLKNFDRMVPRTELLDVVVGFDYLVVLVPLNLETRGLVDEPVFVAMKQSAFLINVARGGVVDEEALVAALDNEEIAGAALDVFEQEPLPADSPLWNQSKLVLTPHLAGFSDIQVDQTLPVLTHNIRAFLDGRKGAMLNLVDR